MANWNNADKKKELIMVKECVSVLLKQKEKYLTSKLMSEMEFNKKMETLFPSFIENYGAIYKMVVKNNDISMLYKMLDDIFAICNGKKEFEDVRNNLGDVLATKYIPKSILDSKNKEKTQSDEDSD
jgi:hypothetical protein